MQLRRGDAFIAFRVHLAPRVVGLARVDVVLDERTGRGAPSLVADDRGLIVAVKLKDHLRPTVRQAAPDAVLRVKSAAQHHADHILAFDQ